MDPADSLEKKILSWLDLQSKGAARLNRLASELEAVKKDVNISQVVGGSVAVGGTVAMTLAGILTVLTGGAALPLLATTGAVVSGLGVATSVGSSIADIVFSSDFLERANQTAENIKKDVEEIKKLINTLKNEWKRKGRAVADCPEDYVMEKLLRSMAKGYGLQINDNIKLINILLGLSTNPSSEDIAEHVRKMSVPMFGLLTQLLIYVASKEVFKCTAKRAGQVAAEGLATVVASAGTKATAKAVGHIGGGAVGLLFSVPDLIVSSISLAKENYVTEDIKNVRKQAEAIRDSSEKMRKELKDIRKLLQKLSNLKNNIENPERSTDKKKSLIRFAMKYCRDEDTRRWLKDNSESEVFSKLVDMFYFLQQQVDKEEKKNHSNNVDITFVAHGSITDQMIPASCLLPLETIKDVVLYSPWNCVLTASAAYDIATGTINPQDRVFYCRGEYSPGVSCNIPDEKHQPTKLPEEWNSMKKAGGNKIPNIRLSPLNPPKDGAWKRLEKLEDEYGRPGRNRILIPFILPGEEGPIPFSVVSLALSLVLMFSRFQATLHLTACLGKRKKMKLDKDALKKQYAYTINHTGMKSSVTPSKRRHKKLYTKLNTVFGERSSG